jgi:hypothetical protein
MKHVIRCAFVFLLMVVPAAGIENSSGSAVPFAGHAGAAYCLTDSGSGFIDNHAQGLRKSFCF